MRTKTLSIQKELREYFDTLPIAGYLREEVYNAYGSMNYYKTRNLFTHKEDFADYLLLLDQENSRSILSLLQVTPGSSVQPEVISPSTPPHDSTLTYYLSAQSILTLSCCQKDKLLSDAFESPSLQAMNSLKAILLFTLSEYLHASPLRIKIPSYHQHLGSMN